MKNRSLRIAPLACALAGLAGAVLDAPVAEAAPPPSTEVDTSRCAVDGVRLSLADAGDTSTVELSVRVRALGAESTTCTVDWTLVSMATPEAAGGTPTVVLSQSYLDHRLVGPIAVADGVASAASRAWRGDVKAEGAVVSLRLLVEGTASGLRVELPRGALPSLTVPGAKVERRVKSARGGTARFGALGELLVPPSAPGAAGGLGPTAALDRDRAVAELIPAEGALAATNRPGPNLTLDVLRDALPKSVLDLSTANDAAWDEIARAAYAAAVHADPVVASLGVHTLAWLGSGLSLQATRIARTAGGPEVAVVPVAVLEAIGDVGARATKRYGGITGKLMPLGRSSTFRKALAAQPWNEPARAKAAKDAVARLATVQATTLTSFVVPALVESTVPVDPPATGVMVGASPSEVAPPLAGTVPGALPSASPLPGEPPRSLGGDGRFGQRFRKRLALAALLLSAVAGIFAFLRRG